VKPFGNTTEQFIVPYFRPPTLNKEKYYSLLDEVFASGIFTNNGPKLLNLEKAIAEIHHYDYCAVVTNATLGLQILYKALNLKSHVITTPFSFVATSSTLLWEELEPVFVDVDEKSLTIDPDLIEQSIKSTTSAVLGVNVFGNTCDYEKISWICKNKNLHEIYDSAHSYGIVDKKARDKTRIEVLSFHSTKVFSTFEGGAILTNSKVLYDKIVKTRNFGFAGMDHVTLVGTNAKMDEIRAAYGIHQLSNLDLVKNKLKTIHQKYLTEIQTIEGLQFVGNNSENSNFHYFPIRIDSLSCQLSRDEVWAFLWSQGIQTRRYFYPLISKFAPYKRFSSHTPIAQRAAEEILCLPCYYDLSDEMISKVIATIQMGMTAGKEIVYKSVKENLEKPYFQPVAAAFKNKALYGY